MGAVQTKSKSNIGVQVDTHVAHTVSQFPENQRPAIEGYLRHIQKVVETYEVERDRARASGTYTLKGLADREADLRRDVERELRKFEEQPIAVLTKRVEDERAGLRQPKAPGEEATLAYLREREMRDLLRQDDPLVRQTKYLAAARSGDNPLLVDAVEGAPTGFELVRPEVRRQAEDLKLQRLSPETGDLVRLRDLYVTFVKLARKEVGIQSGERHLL